ncbi:MAG: HAD family hydrolase, partial [Microthrixaceae bacterium]
RDALKAALLRRLLDGRSERDLDRAAGRYATKLVDRSLRPEMVDEIRRHVAAGHETVFVSASLANYLRPIARYLHMTDVIAVELESRDGVLNGRMSSPNVRAAQKAVRIREWLGAPAVGLIEDVEIWGYGNSSGDYELLDLADHAYWLGKPSKRPRGVIQFDTQGFPEG